jgi:hypothetical protein
MSTKLTAKKRYLPRINAGVSEFKKLGGNLTPSTASAFATDAAPNLARAMDLYGVSLRKGEVPDEISRKAEKLSSVFAAEAKKLSSAKDLTAEYNAVSKTIDDYLDFAKLPPVSSKDY